MSYSEGGGEKLWTEGACNRNIEGILHYPRTGRSVSGVECPLVVRKVVGLIPGQDIPKVVKIWYQ